MAKSKLALLMEQEVKNIIKEIHQDDFQRGLPADSDHCSECGGEEHQTDGVGELRMFYFGGSETEQPEKLNLCQNCYEQRRKSQFMKFSKNEVSDEIENGNEMNQEPEVDQEVDTENPEMEDDGVENGDNLPSMGGENGGGGLKADLISLSDMAKQASEAASDDDEGVEPWVSSHLNAAKELISHVASYFQEKGGEMSQEEPTGDVESEEGPEENPETQGEEQPIAEKKGKFKPYNVTISEKKGNFKPYNVKAGKKINELQTTKPTDWKSMENRSKISMDKSKMEKSLADKMKQYQAGGLDELTLSREDYNTIKEVVGRLRESGRHDDAKKIITTLEKHINKWKRGQ